MFAKFSPDGTRVAYVRANDLYVEHLADGRITRLTSDGSETTINGTSDWVYEEELGVRDGFRWSPDGRAIAYWQFDTTGVGIFTLHQQHRHASIPTITQIPYPKAGHDQLRGAHRRRRGRGRRRRRGWRPRRSARHTTWRGWSGTTSAPSPSSS